MQQHKGHRVLISGGGTGGHIFPAIAIADTIKQMDDRAEFLFVGAETRMEMKKVPEAGYKIEGLNIAGFQRDNMLKNLGLPFKIIGSLLKARKLIKQFKPDVAVGVGGYASGPTMWMAARMGVPVLIQEQNSFAGVTNKLMAEKAQTFCVAYDGMERFFPAGKIVKTGNPVRTNIAYRNVTRQQAIEHFGLDADKKTILVIGGSLGARTINNSIKGSLDQLQQSGHQVLWQTGSFYFNNMNEAAAEYPCVHVNEFIKRMDLAYEVADVIVSRAGAISISELCLIGKPVILVPSPNVAEDHQTKNAMALVDKKAALMVSDIDAPDALVTKTLELINNDALQASLSDHIAQLGIPDAAERIAKEVLKLADK